LMSRVPEATYRAALTAIASFNRLDNLPHIHVPTLCLAAEFDKNAAPAVMEKMAARIVGATFQCLPGVGHLANMEDPHAFNAAILKFLNLHFSPLGRLP
jgi:3-oxoadipate enol-lactonase